MERQPHDYGAASAMAYAQQQRQAANLQQQQQFGLHPQHQAFPPSVHGPPFLTAHPSMQQFPFHHHLQQQPPQMHPHPHLLHLQQQPAGFPPHLAPPMGPPFPGMYDPAPPPPVPPPLDPELQKRIDKLVEYAAKNGPEFEAMIREKQQDNPAYSFLFGGEGHSYYRYKLWISTRSPLGGPFNPNFPTSSMPMMHPSPNPMMNPSSLTASPMNAAGAAAIAASSSVMGAPPMHQPPFSPFYDQQQHQLAFGIHGQPDFDQQLKPFKGLSGPLPSDVAMELNNVLSNLTGAKESIKGAKSWFMQRSPFAPALAEALRDRVFAMDDSERQLHVIYLVNDILFESLPRRIKIQDLDNEALAFKPVLGPMLARVYHNPEIKEENQLKLIKLVQFWASKEVYDQDTINALEGEMVGGPPANSFSGSPKDLPASLDLSAGLPPHATSHSVSQWQPDRQTDQEHSEKHGQAIPPPAAPQQFLSNSLPAGAFAGSIPLTASVQPPNKQPPLLPPQASQIGEKLPPYPLFPPGLIPGMVRKMQIGSGVPYSPMSPLDIPTVIPPSNASPTETLERVSKFFKEIGEVNPSEGPMGSDMKDEDDDYYHQREPPVRKGGACIPPPPNLQVDPETGTYADGSMDRSAGSGSGRLGLGATANPNEVSQYDDVYTSYRKQRSTTYHSSMSARSSTR